MFTHDFPDRKAQAWLRRARRLRESSRLEFDPAERQTLRALAEDCEAIAHRIISRWAATTANDDTHTSRTMMREHDVRERAFAMLVPERLVPDGDTVKYKFIRMPDSTGLGGYTETGQATSAAPADPIVDKDSVEARLRRVAARLANRTVSHARGRKW
jgi:hypothetical protein